MKRAKIMLSAIAVLAIVGGALAFKAQKTSPAAFCITNGQDNVCELAVTSQSVAGGADAISYTTNFGGCTPQSVCLPVATTLVPE